MTQLIFDFEVHQREDNPESQKYLAAGRKSFSRQCRILYDAFMAGGIINTLNSPVSDFRRRRQDLTDVNKVRITLHSTDGKLKQWHMNENDREYNRLNFE